MVRDGAHAATRRVAGGLQLALAVLLVAAIAGIWLMLENQSRRGGDVRAEASSMLSLTELQSALAAVTLAAADTATLTIEGTDHAPEHIGLDDHDVALSLADFDAELERLRAVSRSPELVDEIVFARDRFAEALETFHSHSDTVDLMSVYHGPFQAAQAELEAAVRNMQIVEGEHLAGAIEVSAVADRWLRRLLPLMVAASAAVAASMLRLRRLRRVQEMEVLARENRMKDDFIASVSHELRTPLTSIVGFLDVIRHDDGEGVAQEQAELVEIAAREALDLSNLVEDLLVIARAGAGGLTVASVRVSLRAQTAQVLESMIEPSGVSVVGDAPPVLGDPSRVRQILRNLLNNCQRYGGDRVVVTIGTSAASATLCVVDDGPGVALEDRERIFEPYQRAHRSAGVTGSVGLGLSVSRRLARMMGGDLRYVDVPIGAAFELSLPTFVEQTGHSIVDPADTGEVSRT